MKQILIITTLLSLCACNPCADCTDTIKTTATDNRYHFIDGTKTYEVCGHSDIKKHDDKVVVETWVDGIVTFTTTTTTKCNKK